MASTGNGMIVVFENKDLVPTAWKNGEPAEAARAFNPGLLRDESGWIMAYRVVTEPGLQRRLALCRLDERFRVIPGTIVPLSDAIRFQHPDSYPSQVISWFADPRLYRLGGKIYVYWNSGWHEPQNHQFLQEFDSRSLQPIGSPRELLLDAPRLKLEKNWMLFESGAEVFAVYSVNPHRVLRCSLAGAGPIQCSDSGPAIANGSGFARIHGGLRGGAPPQLVDKHLWSFCHSIEDGPTGYRYVASAYRFDGTFPFKPTDMPTSPLPIDFPADARRVLPKLNPAVDQVIYPGGAVWSDNRWVISLGIDDERCAIALVDSTVVEATLQPVR